MKMQNINLSMFCLDDTHTKWASGFCWKCDKYEPGPNTRQEMLIWSEYDRVAETLAKQGLKGVEGDPLPDMTSSRVVDAINADPESFAERVNDHAYAIAMNKLNLPEDCNA